MFEYKTISGHPRDIVPELNELAEEGWRLVDSVQPTNLHSPTFILERRKR